MGEMQDIECECADEFRQSAEDDLTPGDHVGAELYTPVKELLEFEARAGRSGDSHGPMLGAAIVDGVRAGLEEMKEELADWGHMDWEEVEDAEDDGPFLTEMKEVVAKLLEAAGAVTAAAQPAAAATPADAGTPAAQERKVLAAAAAASSPSRWSLKPVTAEAGSANYLLSEQTTIGRASQQVSEKSKEASAPLKISIDAPGSAGISRTHAALHVSKDGSSLTVVGKSSNLIKVVRATGGASAPLELKQEAQPVALNHDDLLQLDGFRDEPRYVFQVQELCGEPASSKNSPPDDVPTEDDATALKKANHMLKEAQARIAALEQANAAPRPTDVTVDLPPRTRATRQRLFPRNGKRWLPQRVRRRRNGPLQLRDACFYVRRTVEFVMTSCGEAVDCCDQYEADAHEEMVKGALEKHSAEIDGSAFSSLERANEEARQRFLAYLLKLDYSPNVRKGRFHCEGMDPSEDEEDPEVFDKESDEESDEESDVSLRTCGAEVRIHRQTGGKSYEYDFPNWPESGEFEDAEAHREVKFEVLRLAVEPELAQAEPAPRPRKQLATKAARKSAPITANARPLPRPRKQLATKAARKSAPFTSNAEPIGPTQTCPNCEETKAEGDFSTTDCEQCTGRCDDCITPDGTCEHCGLCSHISETPECCCKSRRMQRDCGCGSWRCKWGCDSSTK